MSRLGERMTTKCSLPLSVITVQTGIQNVADSDSENILQLARLTEINYLDILKLLEAKLKLYFMLLALYYLC